MLFTFSLIDFETMITLSRFILDPEAISFDCPRCRWSDRTEYTEHVFNEWALNEPSVFEVSKHNLFLSKYFTVHLNPILRQIVVFKT